LKKIARQNACVCIRLSPCIENNNKNEALFKTFGGLPAAIHAMDAEHSWVLDLAIAEDQILANMRKTTRYEIRRAQKLGVSIEKTTDPASLAVFFDLYNTTAKRHGFVEHQSIKEEFSVFAAAGHALHIIGMVDGKPIACAIILFVGSEAIYHHGASELSSIPASYLVQWEAIREAKKRSLLQYNFWGIAPTENPHHPWYGLTQFKKGFGGTTRTMIHACDIPLSWTYWLFRAVEWIRKQYKGY
jgi:lipid II:glycine glycyltransferase (peptidoglycan interpeptide bridge formation enzyme)